MSCQSWSSVEVTYVQPPQVRVRKMPQKATKAGSLWPGLRERRYQKATRANLGPAGTSQSWEFLGISGSNWVLLDRELRAD